MTTFTPAGFAKAAAEMSALTERLPVPVLAALGEQARKTMAAASKSSGGVHATESEFVFKQPKAKGGNAVASVVGRGFAILDEFGSYHKPNGYDIDPSFTFKPGIGARQGSVLADGNGFFAAYVHHPAQKPHPFVTRAETVIHGTVDAAFDKAIAGALIKAFH